MKVTAYKSYYAWIVTKSSFDPNEKIDNNDVHCAWCKKSKAEIMKTEDPDKHIEGHAKEDTKAKEDIKS